MSALPNFSQVSGMVNELNFALARNRDVVFQHAVTETRDDAANSVYQDGIACPTIVDQFSAIWQAYATGATDAEVGALFADYARAAKLHYAETLADYVDDGGRVTFQDVQR